MNIKNILLTGGRSPITLCLARLFASSGHNVFVADSGWFNITAFSNCIKKSFKIPCPKEKNYADSLISIIQQEKIDFLIPTCEEIFYLSGYLDELRNHCNVVCDTQDKLLLLHDKWTFYNFLKKLEISSPKTALGTGLINGKIIAKPRFSRFAAKINIGNKTPRYAKNEKFIIQEFIKGEQLCSYGFAKNGELIANTIYKTVLTAGKGAGILLEHIKHEEIDMIVRKIVKELNFNGQIAFDFIEDSSGHLYVIECNPRLTTGVCFWEHLSIDILLAKDIPFKENTQTKSIFAAILMYFLTQPIKTLKNLQKIIHSKDIICKRSDLKVFFAQIILAISVTLVAWFNFMSMTEFSTKDIEYNGGVSQ